MRERDYAAAQQGLDEAAEALQQKASSFLKRQAAFESALEALLVGWRPATVALLEQNAASLERPLLRQYETAYGLVHGDSSPQVLQGAALLETLAYVSAQNALLAEKLYRKALTIDYVHERPSDQPSLHFVRTVFASPLGCKAAATAPGASTDQAAPPGHLIVNAGLSVFQPGTTDASSWVVRDAQVSMGFDWSPRTHRRLRPVYTVPTTSSTCCRTVCCSSPATW